MDLRETWTHESEKEGKENQFSELKTQNEQLKEKIKTLEEEQLNFKTELKNALQKHLEVTKDLEKDVKVNKFAIFFQKSLLIIF